MSAAEQSSSVAVRAAGALLPAAVLVAVAIWEIAAALLPSSSAESSDWEAASAFVRSQAKDGQLIVFAPRWVDPVGRQHLGDRISLEMAARADAARFGVIWELSVRGARAEATRGLEATETRGFGGVTVARYEQTPAVVLYDVLEHAGEAKSSKGRATVSLEEVGFEPHRCIKVIPRPDETVSLRFEGVPLGGRIVGYVGLADVFTRRDVRAPGRLELLVDREVKATVKAGVDDGWVRFEAPTEARTAAELEFRLTAVGSMARDRRICFAAEVRQ